MNWLVLLYICVVNISGIVMGSSLESANQEHQSCGVVWRKQQPLSLSAARLINSPCALLPCLQTHRLRSASWLHDLSALGRKV